MSATATEAALERIAIACERIAAIQSRMEQRYLRKTPDVASPDDLDGEYGDQEVRNDPKRWKGPHLAPCKMSEGTSDWLECLADQLEWSGRMAEAAGEMHKGKPVAEYKFRDARLARGWALRNKGKQAPAAPPEPPRNARW